MALLGIDTERRQELEHLPFNHDVAGVKSCGEKEKSGLNHTNYWDFSWVVVHNNERLW